MKFCLCLMGPTAVGKTDLAIFLQQTLPLEIISVDSGMVYRGMDIGTAKPTKQEQLIAPHRLIDIRDPTEPYSVAQFKVDAEREIDGIIAAGKIPLLVGGSMLYFRALQQGLSILPPANQEVRKRFTDLIQKRGLASLFADLEKIDPEAAKRITPNDAKRIVRALEVYEITGKCLSAWFAEQKKPVLPIKFINIILASHARELLHKRIVARVGTMFARGFVEEVAQLYQREDLNENLPAILAVGYRQVWQYLSGRLPEDELVEKVIVATRQLAKKQYTWLRSWSESFWFYLDEQSLANKIVEFCLKSLDIAPK